MNEDDPEKRISELERQLAEAKEQAQQASSFGAMPPPPSGWPQYSPPQPGAASQPQSFPPPPAVGPTGGGPGSWPGGFSSPPTGWQGGPTFVGRRRRGRQWLWLLVVPLLVLWPVVKHPVLQFVDRAIDHRQSAHHGMTAQQLPPEPKACDVLTPDIVKPILGNDANVSKSQQAFCSYQSSRGYGSLNIGNWSSMKPSGSTRPVSGVGDEAVFWADDLYARKGSVGVRITLSEGLFLNGAPGDSDAKRDDAEKTIAQQVLPKL